jgi:hypothetical protein
MMLYIIWATLLFIAVLLGCIIDELREIRLEESKKYALRNKTHMPALQKTNDYKVKHRR